MFSRHALRSLSVVEDGRMAALPKKEQALHQGASASQPNLGGVRETSLPQALLLLTPSVRRTQFVRQTVFTFQLSPLLDTLKP